MLFAGLDVSTQSCKLVIIDSRKEKVVFTASVNYDYDLPEFHTVNGIISRQPEGISESDPKMWLQAVNMVFQKLKDSEISQKEIKCISVSGQQHGLVSLDENGDLTRKTSKLWNDFSTLEECDLLHDAVGGVEKMIEEVGNSQRTGYTAAKIYYMFRHERFSFDKTTTFFLVHNYINWYLTGGVRVMEPGDASGMALWNPKTGKWSKNVIEAIHPTLQKKLPSIRPADESIGTISSKLAESYGFDDQCKIDAGSGDNMYGAVGTGNLQEGIVTVSLGTSGTAYTFMKKPFIDPSGAIAAFCDSTGNYLPLLCVSNLANGYNQIIKQYNLKHDEFNKLVNKTNPGNGGKLLIPWYEGERTPDVPQAAPIYIGFGLDDFTIENLSRAVLEGHILNLYDGFKRMPVKAKEIRLTGGLSQSEVWQQTIADIFEAETVPVEGEGAVLGAALHAGWVWLKENGSAVELIDFAKPFIRLIEEKRKKPVSENVKTYRIMKEMYQSLSHMILSEEYSNPFTLRSTLAG